MKFENTQVMNFKNALRGMRNPKNSWDKSDSFFGLLNLNDTEQDYEVTEAWMQKKHPDMDLYGYEYDNKELNKEFNNIDQWLIKNGTLQTDSQKYPEIAEVAHIGPNDMRLAQQLIKAGPEHRKFMRQIFVSVDITAPLYWWKEFDTYKVGTVANSTSTMHKLTSKPITLDCFEIDDYTDSLNWNGVPIGECVSCYDSKKTIVRLIDMLEGLRLKYLETKDVRYWKELIRWLPESWLQTRTVTFNYENLLAICSKSQRRNHKLNEWSGIHTPVEQSFIQWARTLPYAQEFIFIDEEVKQDS
jgi:hypothetical protein